MVQNVGNFLKFDLNANSRFGRLPGIIIGAQLSSIFGLVKSFSVNYIMYIVVSQLSKQSRPIKYLQLFFMKNLQFEFLEAAGFAFCFTGISVISIELMSTKYRSLGNTTPMIAYPVGVVLLGLAAMYVHDFRWVMRIFHIPGLFVFTYFFLLPESVRWLLVTGRIGRAVKILKRIAAINGKKLSEKTIESIQLRYSAQFIAKKHSTDINESVTNESVLQLFWTVLKSKTLCLRFINCCYQWIACVFSYYGISLSSTQIPGTDRYVSFIIVGAIEFPSDLLAQPLFNRFKRRILLSIAFTVTAISIIITPFIPKESAWVVLLLFVVGKAAISFAFSGIYMYTAEQWPTNIRNTIMNTCSMIGRVGSMISPFAVILVRHLI